jgi:hypothetical protein
MRRREPRRGGRAQVIEAALGVDRALVAEMQSATVYVVAGTVNQNLSFTQTTDNVTVGSSNVVWAQVGTGGSTYVAGNGLTESPAWTFNVGAGTDITVAADAISIDSAYTGLAKRFSANIGDGSTTALVVTHNLNTRDVVVSCMTPPPSMRSLSRPRRRP